MPIRGNRQRHYTLHPDPSVKSFWDYGQEEGGEYEEGDLGIYDPEEKEDE